MNRSRCETTLQRAEVGEHEGRYPLTLTWTFKETTVDIHDVLRKRRSDRHFNGQPLDARQIELLIEAFRWAPSAQNKQPWRLIYAQSPEARAGFDDALNPSNHKWAVAAPVKFVVLGAPDDQPDRNGLPSWMLETGLALENMLLQGCSMGLTTHSMSGWNEQKVLQNFHIPQPFRVLALVVAGHPGRVEDLPDDVKAKDLAPRVRKAVEEIVYRDVFGSGLR